MFTRKDSHLRLLPLYQMFHHYVNEYIHIYSLKTYQWQHSVHDYEFWRDKESWSSPDTVTPSTEVRDQCVMSAPGGKCRPLALCWVGLGGGRCAVGSAVAVFCCFDLTLFTTWNECSAASYWVRYVSHWLYWGFTVPENVKITPKKFLRD